MAAKKLPLSIPTRTLVRRALSVDNVMHAIKLEDVRDQLERIAKAQDVLDPKVRLDRLFVTFTDGVMRATIKGATHPKLKNDMFLLTNGASQLHSDVLPGRFWAGFKQLVTLNPDLAEKVWTEFAQTKGKTRRVLRTVNISRCEQCGTPFGKAHADAGHRREIYRAIRAVVSDRYNMYSNLAMVEDILTHAGRFASLPVLNWWLTDSGIRIRFLGVDTAIAAFAGFDESVLLNEPLPMVDIWNSEVGRSVVGMTGGAYNLRTASGIGHWDERRSFAWRHVGREGKITAGVRNSFVALTQTAADVVEAYKAAANVNLEDPKEWLRGQLEGSKTEDGKKLSKSVVAAAVKALEADEVTPGGKLATIVDALTLVAAAQDDIYSARDVEKAAARILKRGAEIAAKNGGTIPAPEKEE